jgi:hypothetical protein
MKKKVAKPPQLAQTGWCGQEFLDHTTPSAPLKEASLLLLCVAATPPPAEEGSRLLQLSNRSWTRITLQGRDRFRTELEFWG